MSSNAAVQESEKKPKIPTNEEMREMLKQRRYCVMSENDIIADGNLVGRMGETVTVLANGINYTGELKRDTNSFYVAKKDGSPARRIISLQDDYFLLESVEAKFGTYFRKVKIFIC